MADPEFLRLGSRYRARARLLALLLLGLVVAGWMALRQCQQNARYVKARLERQTRQLTEAILANLHMYELGLRDSRGTVVALGEERLNRESFRQQWRGRDIDREFPGARGFGFIRRVPAESEAAFLRAARRDGMPTFSLRQLGANGGERWVVQYIEPADPNREAVGVDIASETERRQAAQTSMRTGQATLTAPITLVQAVGLPERGFLFLLPVYRMAAPRRTAPEREAAAYGWTYAPLIIDEVVRGITLPGVVLALSDVTPGARPAPFYASAPREKWPANGLTSSLERSVYGRVWRIDVHAGPRFTKDLNLRGAAEVFLMGVVGAVLISALLHAYLVSHERKLQVLSERARLSTIVENSSDAIVAESLDGRIVSWNKAAELIFGWRASDAVGKNVRSLGLSMALVPEERSKLEGARQGENVAPFDTVRHRRDGSSVDVSIAASPLRSPDGRIIGVAKTIRDISDRKANERQLQEFNAKLEEQVSERTAQLEAARHDLQTILDAMPSMVGYWDKDGLNRFANWAYHRWFGIDPGKMPGMHIRTLLGERLYEQNRPHIEAALRGEPQTFERSIPRPDGQGDRHSLAYYLPDVRDGQVHGFYVMVHDVTELTESRQKLAAALRENARERRRLAESEAFLERAGRVAGVGGWQLDLASSEMTWTRQTYRIHEVPDDYQPTLRAASEFYAPHARAVVQRAVQAAVERGEGWDLELPFITANGRPCWVRSVGEVQLENGRATKLIGSLQDVTARREADDALRTATLAAQAASAAKSEFLANMSHEIRSPLNAVIGLAHLLEHTALDARQRGYLKGIHASSRSLLGVIDDVLDLSKIEAGEMALEHAPFELTTLVEDVRTMMAPQAELKRLELKMHVAPDARSWLRGDATRLRQILTNLLSNAIKFTERGHVELSISCLSRSEGRVRLRCSVRDTGIGIAPEAIPRLFAPFTQADTSTTRRFGGTGLGLSIVKRLTNLMGGEVGVHSEPDVGSEFWVDLPLEVSEGSGLTHVSALGALTDDHEAARLPAGAGESTGVALDCVRVLVVDDSEVNREVVRNVLEREGAMVSACASGQEALERLRGAPSSFDLVLMDVQMPAMDGNEATRRLRKELGLTTLPVVALTAGALTGERQRALEAGMNDFISKPFEPKLLIRIVRRYTKQARGALRSVQSRARQKSGFAPAWPEIEGIDTQKASERFEHDVALFTSLLRRFLREYSAWDCTEAPSPDDMLGRAQLAGRAHKLRGAAGVMGAVTIERLAACAETALRSAESDPNLGATLSALSSALTALAESARPLLEASLPETPSTGFGTASMPAPQREELEALRALLQQHDLSALERFELLSETLRTMLGQEAFERLSARIKDLDFMQAAALLPVA